MNDVAGSHSWLIIGGIAIVVLYFKGYLRVPQGLLDRLSESGGQRVEHGTYDPFQVRPPCREPPHDTHRLVQMLAEAAVRESHREIASKMAGDLRVKLMEGLTAPFSGGGTPATPPGNPAQK